MFDSLTDRLGTVFERLGKRGALSDADIDSALRDVRIALLEADVALPVVKSFIERVRVKAHGEEVVRSVAPAQMVVKIVHDCMVETLGGATTEIDLKAEPPVAILMLGLQGSGKTTTVAKIGLRLKTKEKKKVLLASADVYRPAAQEQLRILGEQAGIDTLDIKQGEQPDAIARRALEKARLEGFDVLILDTAGRMHIDEALMAEAGTLSNILHPVETLLVADAMTGQDAVNVAQGFHERIGITGIVLSRVDGDARGGAALSMREVTGCPVKLIGTGEKIEQIEAFHPDRAASRILGMGDVVSLVEKASEAVEEAEAEKLAAKIKKGNFDLADMAKQLSQMRRMGGAGALLNMLPGIGKVKKQLDAANIDDAMLKRQEAIISSMTLSERRRPKLLNASRRRRIASGSGTSIQEVNRLLKQHREVAATMKKVGKMGKKGMMRGGFPGMDLLR
jgi:signal recognition particle subunit SRP54